MIEYVSHELKQPLLNLREHLECSQEYLTWLERGTGIMDGVSEAETDLSNDRSLVTLKLALAEVRRVLKHQYTTCTVLVPTLSLPE